MLFWGFVPAEAEISRRRCLEALKTGDAVRLRAAARAATAAGSENSSEETHRGPGDDMISRSGCWHDRRRGGAWAKLRRCNLRQVDARWSLRGIGSGNLSRIHG